MTTFHVPPASVAITVPQTRFVRFAPAPAEQTLMVQGESRSLAIPHEIRSIWIAGENRTLTIAAERRTFSVPHENRSLPL